MTASRAALLELRQEREVAQEGHGFLDEKRILLAREILRRLNEYRLRQAEMAGAEAAARAALADALGTHGLEHLQLHPPPDIERRALALHEAAFLGVGLPDGRLELRISGYEGPGAAFIRACSGSFATLAGLAAQIAVAEAALLRLCNEYRRTERRVRALENLILPDLRGREREMLEILEENEMEEAIRVRTGTGFNVLPAFWRRKPCGPEPE